MWPSCRCSAKKYWVLCNATEGVRIKHVQASIDKPGQALTAHQMLSPSCSPRKACTTKSAMMPVPR